MPIEGSVIGLIKQVLHIHLQRHRITAASSYRRRTSATAALQIIIRAVGAERLLTAWPPPPTGRGVAVMDVAKCHRSGTANRYVLARLAAVSRRNPDLPALWRRCSRSGRSRAEVIGAWTRPGPLPRPGTHLARHFGHCLIANALGVQHRYAYEYQTARYLAVMPFNRSDGAHFVRGGLASGGSSPI